MWRTEKTYENQKGNMMELSYFALIGAAAILLFAWGERMLRATEARQAGEE